MKLIRISAIWCTSCILTYKYFNEIKEKYPFLEYEELDYDIDDIEKYNVGNILPVLILMRDDKELTRIVGEKNTKEISDILEGVIDEEN